MKCRCEVLNVMSGDGVDEYAREHLDAVRSDGQGRTYYRCPDTGVGWAEERAPGAFVGGARRLRREDRAASR